MEQREEKKEQESFQVGVEGLMSAAESVGAWDVRHIYPHRLRALRVFLDINYPPSLLFSSPTNYSPSQSTTMSDYEDEMDVDAPPSKDIQFSSDKSSGKTKRLTADLPVEAADNLPW